MCPARILILLAPRRGAVRGIDFRGALYVRVANGAKRGGAPRPPGASYMKCSENSYETGRQGNLVCKRGPCSNILYNKPQEFKRISLRRHGLLFHKRSTTYGPRNEGALLRRGQILTSRPAPEASIETASMLPGMS